MDKEAFVPEVYSCLIPIRGRSAVVDHAIVDESDSNMIDSRWCLGRHGYAMRSSPHKNGVPTKAEILMHRAIMRPAKGEYVDHINGDKLDNRRSNLRIVTNRENATNRHHAIKSNSGFRNITYYPKKRLYMVTVRSRQGKTVYGGKFKSLEMAVVVAERCRKENGYLTDRITTATDG